MLLIKQNTLYTISHETEYYKLEGKVSFIEEEMIINVQASLKNGNYIGTCSYRYINKDNCSKIIGDCQRQYIRDLEDILENILDFLIRRFDLQ